MRTHNCDNSILHPWQPPLGFRESSVCVDSGCFPPVNGSPHPAFDQGVVINLDDVSLVQSLVKARGRCPDIICFRLNPGVGHTDSETASNVLGGPASKFGVPPDQIVEGYRQAAAAGATRFGLHAMIGSCVMDDEVM